MAEVECGLKSPCIMEDKVDEIHRTIHGNGREGVLTRMARIEVKQDSMNTAIEDIKRISFGILISVAAGIIFAVIRLI